MCAIPFKGFDRKIHIKREAVTVSLFMFYKVGLQTDFVDGLWPIYMAVRTAGRLKAIF